MGCDISQYSCQKERKIIRGEAMAKASNKANNTSIFLNMFFTTTTIYPVTIIKPIKISTACYKKNLSKDT